MMSMTIEGMDDLIRSVNSLGNLANKAGKKAIEAGGEIIVDALKAEAPRAKGGSIVPSPSMGNSANYLKAQKVTSKQGTFGIGSNNWEQTKALWFQHYGFFDSGLNFHGSPYVANNTGWKTRAEQKCASAALSKTVSVLKKEIDKLW